MPSTNVRDSGGRWWLAILTVTLLLGAVGALALSAPGEATMGHAQRVLYIHVPVAWTGLLATALMAGSSLLYVLGRDLRWDHWARAATELGWLFGGLTLATGSLWAHAAWGSWWTWDPRLTTSFVLFLIYSGCLLTRASVPDPHRQARLSAVLACVVLLDLPLVILATRWFRGIHPVSPQMEPAMRVILTLSAVCTTVLFLQLLYCRQKQLRVAAVLAVLRQQPEHHSTRAAGQGGFPPPAAAHTGAAR